MVDTGHGEDLIMAPVSVNRIDRPSLRSLVTSRHGPSLLSLSRPPSLDMVSNYPAFEPTISKISAGHGTCCIIVFVLLYVTPVNP